MPRASGVCPWEGVKVKTRTVNKRRKKDARPAASRGPGPLMYARKMKAPLTSESGRGEGVGAGLMSGGGCGGAFGFFAGFAGALDTGGFATQVAEIVESGASNVALAGNFDRGDGR